MKLEYGRGAILAATIGTCTFAATLGADAVNYSRMSTRLAGILDANYRGTEETVDDIKATMEFLGQIDVGPGGDPDKFYVYIDVGAAFSVADVPGYVDVVDQREDWKLIAGWVSENDLADLSEVPAVEFIRCVDPPRFRVQGSIDTQGNALHKADNARLNRGVTGASIKVGVVSDGASNWLQVAGAGDLPGDLELPFGPGSGDEGTAMLEIIHDLAPHSHLAFVSSGINKMSFVGAVTSLVQGSNCQIVCDDVGFYSEPYFFQGYVANQFQLLGAGTSYLHVTAAGNDAEVHHQQIYTDVSPVDGEHDPLLQATLPPGGVVEVWLQWNDHLPNFGNYDLFLNDSSTGTNHTKSIGTTGGYPGEFLVHINNTGSSQTVDAVIKHVGGNANRTMEVFFELWNGATITPASQPNFSGVDAIFGHAAEPTIVAVGAVNQATPTVIEPFSSQGPVTVVGMPPISKPDVVGVDNVNVSVGVTVPGSGFPTSFSGTSAAAPHIAGILALAWDYSPGVSPSGLVSAMNATAGDLGVLGYDFVFGNGLADADASAGALNLPPALTRPFATINATQKVGRPISGLAVSDPDAGSSNLSLNLSATTATIMVEDTVPGGLTAIDIVGNGTNNVTVTAPAATINTTLATTNGVAYLDHGGPIGFQSLDLYLSDNGNSGFGGALNINDLVSLHMHSNAYETWARDNFGSDVDDPGKEPTVWGYLANPDKDAYLNQWDFFIGADPNSADAPGAFVHAVSGSNFSYTFRVSDMIDSNAYDVRYSTNLSNWTGVPIGQWSISPHATLPEVSEVTVTRSLTTKEFIRIWFDPGYVVP